MSPQMTGLIIDATWQTLEMVLISCMLTILLGLPLGVLLLVTRKQNLFEGMVINRCLSFVINIVRSVPFIILMVSIAPLTQLIVGSSIGTAAAIVPLTISATPFFARVVESALQEVPFGLIEASQAMGASPLQIIYKVMLPEAMAGIVRGVTLMMITLVGYTAIAGAIGAGGLGDVAIRYGYQRFEMGVMIITVVILIVIVQLLQYCGDFIAARLSHQP